MDCVFCKIAKGEVPSKKIYEDADTVAFLDISPRNPGHALVIPKKHYGSILDIPENELANLMKTVKKVVVATKNATNSDGTSIVQSNGRAAGQMVGHIHFHVIPRFMSEGPPSLEGVLQIKRFDNKSMDALVGKIKAGFGTSLSAGKIPEKQQKPQSQTSDDVFAGEEELFKHDD
jgi:histidine triad (HIT) family protein